MHDDSEQPQRHAFDARLDRLEADMRAQREEMGALRTLLQRMVTQGIVTQPLASQPLARPANEPLQVPTETRQARPVATDSAATSPARRSVENRIGSQLFNRIGIVALLVGVALFLKLAIDNHWIHFTPTGRVLAGLLGGAGLVLWSERFRRKGYAPFSYSLKAVGTGTLYLSLWASFQMYHLLPASVALAAMIAVTVWNAVMAWAQDSELLAAYALIGGFGTPALLGTGGNHEVFLFTYLLAMDVAVILLLVRKPWQRLLLGSFPSTALYFIGWYTRFFTEDKSGLTALFAILLSAPFVAVALVGKQREEASEGVLAPLAAAAFLAAGLYSVLEDSHRHGWLPWVAVVLAAFYLALMRARRSTVAEAVHLAIAVVFLTIAIPLKAEGRWITIGWLAEGVALIGVAAMVLKAPAVRRVRSALRWLGCTALALGVAGSLVGGLSLFGPRYVPPSAFFNRDFATQVCAAVALAVGVWLARKAAALHSASGAGRIEPWMETAAGCLLGFNLLLLSTVTHQIALYFHSLPTGEAGFAQAFTISAWLMLYGGALLAAGFWQRIAFVRWQGLILLVFTIAKVFLYDTRNLSSIYRVLSFFALGVLLMAVSFAYQKDWLKLRDDTPGAAL